MAEQRKSSHGQAFDLSKLADAQIETWPTRHPIFAWVPPAETASPLSEQERTNAETLERLNTQTGFRTPRIVVNPPVDVPPTPAPQPLRPEVRDLLQREPPTPKDALREAFATWLEQATWACDTCGGTVQSKTLRVPPPVIERGVPRFRMFCSEACAAAA